MENADVIAGVQGQQFLIGHAVVLGNEGPHIAALNGIGHLARLGGVEFLGDIAQIHNKGLIHVLLLYLHVFHEVAVHGAVGDVALFQLLQQLLDGAGEGGGRHRLPLHIQHIGIIHQPQLLGEVLLQCVGALQLLPGHDAGADLQLGAVDAVIGIGQCLPGDLLQLIHCRRNTAGAVDRSQLHAVIAGGGADGIHGQAHRHGRHRHGAGHKHRRMQLHVLEEGPHPSAGANGPLAAAGEPLPEVGAHTGQTAPEEQQQLAQLPLRLRQLPLPVLVPQLPQTLPPAAQGLADMGRYPRLHIQIQPVRMLLTKPDPILQILLPPLPDAAALLRIGTLIFQFLFHMIDPC